MSIKKEKFTVQARVTVEIGIHILADSFEDALAQSSKLDELKFVKPLGDYIDGKMKISAIWSDEDDFQS